MNEEKIKLHEAMTKPINKRVRTWIVSGKHIKDADIAEEYTVERTFVMKAEDRDYEVGVEMTKEGDKGIHIGIIAEISTLDGLKEKFPQLFELEGKLFTFA